tara:strand:- start:1569 stop:1847 length:279 start_codon:yes stop_codon:yes gene_type:complete
MRISRRRLKKILRETTYRVMEGCPAGDMPCPIQTAQQIIAAGAGPDEIAEWAAQLMEELRIADGDTPLIDADVETVVVQPSLHGGMLPGIGF